MVSETVPSTGVDILTLLDLLEKAAAYKGLKLQEGALEAYSEPIKVYELNNELLAILAQQGIKEQTRPDCRNEIFTLMDENLQEKIPGLASSNYWNFKLLKGKRHEFDLHVSLSVSFMISTKKRGIILWPQVHGSFLSATDRLPNFRMFRTLAESDKDAPVVAKELAASDGNIVVTWADLGLDGIRRITDLFSEFAGQNEAIMQLDRSQEVFDPNPNPLHQQPGDKLFIPEPAQPRVIQAWRTQVKEYCACLAA